MSQKHKILIADDEPNILLSLEFLMKKMNYEVFIARNGSEAMEILKTEIPDLVVLDVMMPDLDGYEICKHIRKTALLKHIKVVFISAKTKEVDIAKGLALGADDYITKPFSTRFLMNRVKELLQPEGPGKSIILFSIFQKLNF
ncbi:MAG: response regulator [Chitinophagales bacterium]